jgi:hypothetical protein
MNALSLKKTVTKKSCRIIGRCRNTGELSVRSSSPTDPSGRSSLVSLQPNRREIYAPSVLRFKVNSRTLRPGAFLIIVRPGFARGDVIEQFRGSHFFSLSSLSKKDKGWFEHGNHAELSLAEIQEANMFAFPPHPISVRIRGASGCRRKTRSGRSRESQSATHQLVAAQPTAGLIGTCALVSQL